MRVLDTSDAVDTTGTDITVCGTSSGSGGGGGGGAKGKKAVVTLTEEQIKARAISLSPSLSVSPSLTPSLSLSLPPTCTLNLPFSHTLSISLPLSHPILQECSSFLSEFTESLRELSGTVAQEIPMLELLANFNTLNEELHGGKFATLPLFRSVLSLLILYPLSSLLLLLS